MKRNLAVAKLDILKGQEKKNVGAAEIEVSASKEYENCQNQEDKLYSVDELIRISKHSASEF